jgi:ferric-dicitrate binding protein FerR (iron transport regulator)
VFNTSDEPDFDTIWSKVQLFIQNEKTIKPKAGKMRVIKRLSVAAAILAIMATGILYFSRPGRSDRETDFIVRNTDLHIQKNNSEKPKDIYLEDGTHILLQPNSSISYPLHFTAVQREVSLTGDAYFEVTRNPGKPFLVYTANLVTRVLGTSFNISSSTSSREVVSVHSGKVQVYEKTPVINSAGRDDMIRANGVILTANQKVIFSTHHRDFQTTLIERPLPLTDSAFADTDFDFNRVTLKDVMERIQRVYGVNIVFENELLSDCLFSGELSDENLYEKLSLVCQSVNASYDVSGTSVLIRGKGCK